MAKQNVDTPATGVVLNKTVVLVGMMGAGKTAVGGALARRLGVGFVDQDDEIEAAAARSIGEIFEDYGEAFFRAKESQVLARLLAAPPHVLSTGGGAFLAPRNRALIDASAVSVWLDAGLELLWARVRHRSTRPLLQKPRPKEVLARLYAERAPLYALARLRVAVASPAGIEETAGMVLSALAEAPGVLGPRNGATGASGVADV